MMLRPDADSFILTEMMRRFCSGQQAPPAGLLEQRIIELERLGLIDDDDFTDEPSSLRQFAIATLTDEKPGYFITMNPELLVRRECLEYRYGIEILSVPEAILLLKAADGPPN